MVVQLLHFNRTIWNWNIITTQQPPQYYSILIEPFGIETNVGRGLYNHKIFILIEPFGIETHHELLMSSITVKILIEPFGIETSRNISGVEVRQVF